MVDVYWDRIQVHVNGWGGHFVDPADPSVCRMGDAEALAALEWLRARMWDDQVMATLSDVNRLTTQQAFIAGKIAMVEDGSWGLKNILSNAQFRIGVAPFPSGPVRKVTLATTDGFGIYAGTKHPEAAWELMKFLISKDYGRAMAHADFLQPARASILEDWIGYVHDEFPQQSKDVDLAAFAEGHLKGYSVVAEIFAKMGDAQRIAQDAWDKILTLGQAPTESMVEASRQIQAAQS
jgi:multiple sugar transport system substrate-binding protein